ncbi:MAG: transposase domain-containing protein [Pseudomonadota bacterium]|nr:transposase domain-containing protein [Pseudomonadota bacterium]
MQAKDSMTGREWFTAAELAELALPGLPAEKRALNRWANEKGWAYRKDQCGELLVRKRAGRGGGMEYHVSLLPGQARLALADRGISADIPALPPIEQDVGGWRWFDAQSTKVKAEAELRVRIIHEVEVLEETGMSRTSAVSEVSKDCGKSVATIWNWIGLVEGIAPSNRLPALAPRRRGGGVTAEIDPELWSILKSDYLRPSEPTFASCYDRVAAIARERGLSLPSKRTLSRRVEREIPRGIVIKRRKGAEALRRSIPAERRTVEHLNAMDIVNIDGHKFDVWVVPPGGGKPVRPLMVALQDVYSSKVLSWCIDLTENTLQTQIALAGLFRDWGIPKSCLLDNGRAFASKAITGGAKTRFRFKIRESDPTGILTALGIQTHWALPYRGQSKPIERAFRDMCDRIARHPACEGAYTGNSVVNKPENYGQRAMGWDEFCAHVAKGIAEHNARKGRTGRHYAGRSFDEVFTESYARSAIGKATPEQLRVALLTAEQKTVDRQTGMISLFGNRYWSAECHDLAGRKVTVRFDPDKLHGDIFLYDQEGHFLATAHLHEDQGFDTQAGAVASSKRLAAARKAVREGEEAERFLSAEQVAAMQPAAQAPQMPDPGAVRMVRHRGQTAAAVKALPTPQGEQTISRESRVFRALQAWSRLKIVE